MHRLCLLRRTSKAIRYALRLGYAVMLLPIWVAMNLVVTPVHAAAEVPIVVKRTHLTPASMPCTDHFVVTDLDHLTTTADGVIRMFQANGAGLAAGDLDGDGDLDLVLGAMIGEDSILWNDGRDPVGGVFWRPQRFGTGQARMVTLVDVDADGRLDIVMTRSTGALNYYHNQGIDPNGNVTLVQTVLAGVSAPASVIGWADLDGDGDLDLVTATYDASLLTDLGNSYLLGGSGGILVYTQHDGRFRPVRLATTAQANTLLLQDVDDDGLRDLWVGNDFVEPDRMWRQTGDGGWEAMQPFSVTTHSTMSLDAGDLNNNGNLEFFATDMLPYADDAATLAAWEPLMTGDDGRPPSSRRHSDHGEYAASPAYARQLHQRSPRIGRGRDRLELVGQVWRLGQQRLSRPLRGQRHGRGAHVCPPA